MHRVHTYLMVLALFLFPCVLRAQSTNASVAGRVTDPSKATIAEAKVAAINTGTNFRYETKTNSSGEYFLTNLPPGTYSVELEMAGFKKLIRPNVVLHVQDALEINFEMSLGSATEAITVGADVLPVDTVSGTVSTVIARADVSISGSSQHAAAAPRRSSRCSGQRNRSDRGNDHR